MSLVEALKKKSRVKWTELRGEKIGIRVLTRNEMTEHIANIENAEGDREVFAVFAEYIVDASGSKALTVDEMEEVLTNKELKNIIDQFNKTNGMEDDEDSEKN